MSSYFLSFVMPGADRRMPLIIIQMISQHNNSYLSYARPFSLLSLDQKARSYLFALRNSIIMYGHRKVLHDIYPVPF
jgi:hypothetical protein